MKDVEKDIILAIYEGTQRAADQKDKIWHDMQKKLEAEKMKEKRKKNRRILWKSLAAVLLIGAVFLAATPSGRAAVGNFLDLFEPEKNIEWEMEGQPEDNDFQLHTSNVTPAPDEEGNAVSYVIYVDESRYYTETVDGADRILPLDYPEDYPTVYMAISQDAGRAPAAIAAELEPKVRAEYTDTVIGPKDVTDPIDAIEIRGYAGIEWNSPVVRYYLIDNTLGGTFVVKMQYFLEAEEGHGERFDTMLREFQIVPAQGTGNGAEPSTAPASPVPEETGNTPAPESPTPEGQENGVSYAIDIDESRFALEKKDGADRIVPLNFPEDYPPTFMAITQDTGRSPDEVAAELKTKVQGEYVSITGPQSVTDPADAVEIIGVAGNEWNSPVVRYYLIDNTAGGTFVVQMQYFLEAEEGYGARFNTMLHGFQIVR
jgi:hypothetical protein